jgi:hypothetical protein
MARTSSSRAACNSANTSREECPDMPDFLPSAWEGEGISSHAGTADSTAMPSWMTLIREACTDSGKVKMVSPNRCLLSVCTAAMSHSSKNVFTCERQRHEQQTGKPAGHSQQSVLLRVRFWCVIAIAPNALSLSMVAARPCEPLTRHDTI